MFPDSSPPPCWHALDSCTQLSLNHHPTRPRRPLHPRIPARSAGVPRTGHLPRHQGLQRSPARRFRPGGCPSQGPRQVRPRRAGRIRSGEGVRAGSHLAFDDGLQPASRGRATRSMGICACGAGSDGWLQVTPVNGPHSNFQSLAKSTPFRTVRDYDNYLKRLEAFPRAMPTEHRDAARRHEVGLDAARARR